MRSERILLSNTGLAEASFVHSSAARYSADNDANETVIDLEPSARRSRVPNNRLSLDA